MVNLKKETLRNEETTAAAFNDVIKALEKDLELVTRQRDEVREKLAVMEQRKLARGRSSVVSATVLAGAGPASPAGASSSAAATDSNTSHRHAANGGAAKPPFVVPPGNGGGGGGIKMRALDIASSASGSAMAAPRRVVKGLRRTLSFESNKSKSGHVP